MLLALKQDYKAEVGYRWVWSLAGRRWKWDDGEQKVPVGRCKADPKIRETRRARARVRRVVIIAMQSDNYPARVYSTCRRQPPYLCMNLDDSLDLRHSRDVCEKLRSCCCCMGIGINEGVLTALVLAFTSC